MITLKTNYPFPKKRDSVRLYCEKTDRGILRWKAFDELDEKEYCLTRECFAVLNRMDGQTDPLKTGEADPGEIPVMMEELEELHFFEDRKWHDFDETMKFMWLCDVESDETVWRVCSVLEPMLSVLSASFTVYAFVRTLEFGMPAFRGEGNLFWGILLGSGLISLVYPFYICLAALCSKRKLKSFLLVKYMGFKLVPCFDAWFDASDPVISMKLSFFLFAILSQLPFHVCTSAAVTCYMYGLISFLCVLNGENESGSEQDIILKGLFFLSLTVSGMYMCFRYLTV